MDVRQRKGGKKAEASQDATTPASPDTKATKAPAPPARSGASFARCSSWAAILLFSFIVAYHATSFYYTHTFAWHYADAANLPNTTFAHQVLVRDRPQFVDIVLRLVGPPLRVILKLWDSFKLPKIDGELDFVGLRDKVRVVRDGQGVPHIYAKNKHDMFFAQGFVHAQDRLFQMEISRYVSGGRISELVGRDALDTDRYIRTIGLPQAGHRAYAELASEEKGLLQAYCDGINAYIRMGSFSVDFNLLGHTPPFYHPENVTSLYKLMSWQMSMGWGMEITRSMLEKAVGPERAAEWDLEYPTAHPHTVPLDIEKEVMMKILKKKELNPEQPTDYATRKAGSNAWTVSGKRSKTGRPLLANDPHLKQTTPSIWYFVHLIAENDVFNAWGASVPGLPSLAIGHNEHVAWGVTLTCADLEDLFIEKLSEDGKSYLYKDEWLPLTSRQETIMIKGEREPHVETIYSSKHGPLVTKVVLPTKNNKEFPAVAYATTALATDVKAGLTGLLNLARARNWDDFVVAASNITDISLNIVYADVHGDVGYFATGTVPKRVSNHRGHSSVPGWTGEFDWTQGYVPMMEMPHGRNPADGVIFTNNHKIVTNDYPHYLGSTWMNGYRADRLRELLASKKEHSLVDFAEYQHDTYSKPGEQFVKLVKHYLGPKMADLPPRIRQAVKTLDKWDFVLSANSLPGTIYEVSRYFIVRHIAEPSLGRELTNLLMGDELLAEIKAASEYLGHDTVAVLRMMQPENQAKSWWVQQAGGPEKILLSCLNNTIDWLHRELGDNSSEWTWGRLHSWPFPHALGAVKPLDQVYNPKSIPIGGDTDTLMQMAFSVAKPYASSAWTPSTQLLFDVGDWSRSVWKFYPGNSGNLASKHYADFHARLVEDVENGETRPERSSKKHYVRMLWLAADIEAEATATLNMIPA